MFTKTIERYICLSVTDCKRLGYFAPNAVASGVVSWTQGETQVAAVVFTTNTQGAAPYATLRYTYRGQQVETSLTLRYKPSNLNNGAGYYYFVCPVTGLSCRKLYLVEGKFVGRQAFRPLYAAQTESRRERTGLYAFLRKEARLEDMTAEPYRRYTYRGKPTPFARRVDKLASRLDVFGDNIAGTIRRKGWGALN